MSDRSTTNAQGVRASLVPGLEPPRPIASETGRAVRPSSIIAMLVSHWPVVILTGLFASAVVVAILFLSPRKYEASVTVAPIGNARQLNLPGGLAGSLLGAAMGGGLQATPIFVARLARLTGVLSDVALTPIPGDTSHVIVERLLGAPLKAIPPYKYSKEIDKVLKSTVDRESGTVTLEIVHRDSALARITIDALVAEVRRSYARTNKAQASQLRDAQVTRVDSASQQLRQAQAAVVAFTSSNRVVAPYSSQWIQGQRLQNNLQVAQSVYTAAVSDLQAAQGKELENAPALVILDSVPAFLPPHGRGTLAKGIIALLFGSALAIAFLIVREAATNASRYGDAGAQQIIYAVSRLPIIRGPVFRWFIRQNRATANQAAD